MPEYRYPAESASWPPEEDRQSQAVAAAILAGKYRLTSLADLAVLLEGEYEAYDAATDAPAVTELPDRT